MCDQKCVMVTGASGLLGRAIFANLATLGDEWRVIGIAKSRCGDKFLHLDLLNADQVRETISRLKPQVIIHSAAERSCEKVDADYKTGFHFNVTIPGVISAAAAEYGGLVVYISTDYVFDGNSPPYSETHATSPINSYGKTKYEGEIATLDANPRSLVLRVPVLYGPVEYIKESAVTCLLEVLTTKKDGLVPVSNYEIRYPTHVNDVAKCCTQLVQKALKASFRTICNKRMQGN
jgi:S-adenosylmethionine synthetase